MVMYHAGSGPKWGQTQFSVWRGNAGSDTFAVAPKPMADPELDAYLLKEAA